VTRARQSHTQFRLFVPQNCPVQCSLFEGGRKQKEDVVFHPVLHPQLDVLSCSTSTPTGDGVDWKIPRDLLSTDTMGRLLLSGRVVWVMDPSVSFSFLLGGERGWRGLLFTVNWVSRRIHTCPLSHKSGVDRVADGRCWSTRPNFQGLKLYKLFVADIGHQLLKWYSSVFSLALPSLYIVSECVCVYCVCARVCWHNHPPDLFLFFYSLGYCFSLTRTYVDGLLRVNIGRRKE
jgi:hypothetical protein